MNTLVFAHPNFVKEICLEIDASQWGIGAILMQGHPIGGDVCYCASSREVEALPFRQSFCD